MENRENVKPAEQPEDTTAPQEFLTVCDYCELWRNNTCLFGGCPDFGVAIG